MRSVSVVIKRVIIHLLALSRFVGFAKIPGIPSLIALRTRLLQITSPIINQNPDLTKPEMGQQQGGSAGVNQISGQVAPASVDTPEVLNIVDGGVQQPSQLADSFVESSISGKVFVVDGKLGRGNSPYMHCLVGATLTGNSKQLTSRVCDFLAHNPHTVTFLSDHAALANLESLQLD